jgi:FkbH-like protein
MEQSVSGLTESKVRQAIEISVAATFTVKPLMEFLLFWAQQFGWSVQMDFSPLGQVFPTLLRNQSESSDRTLEVRLILLRMGDWAKGSASLEQTVGEFVQVLRNTVERTSIEHIVCICPDNLSLINNPSLIELLKYVEEMLADGLSSLPNTTLLWGTKASESYAVKSIHDDTSDRLGDVPYTDEYYAAIATTVFRKIAALCRVPLKAIVCDCDNTLWKGIVAEDGIGRLFITATNRKLHKILAEQKRQGVMLCLCSKNEMVDVAKVFECRSDIEIKWNDFIAKRINWSSKSDNIRSLAAELNIGLDSFVFIDDDPIECAEVRSNCPEVSTLQMHLSSDTDSFIDHFWMFDATGATSEAMQRTQLYVEDRKRKNSISASPSLGDYIDGLQLKIEASILGPQEIPRVVELMYRTNQFNTTGLKMSQSDLRLLLESGTLEGRTYKVMDKYGDYGLVGVVLFCEAVAELNVKAMLLSCRSLGRGVEHRMAADCGLIAINKKLQKLVFQYCPSNRNQPARIFLDNAIGNAEITSEGAEYRIPAESAAAIKPNLDDSVQKHELHGSELRGNSGVYTDATGEVAQSALFMRIAEHFQTGRSVVNAARGIVSELASPVMTQTLATPMEQTVAKIWSELLGFSIADGNADFFDLGGDSLKAIRVLSRVQKEFEVALPLTFLFEGRMTIATLCSAIKVALEMKN